MCGIAEFSDIKGKTKNLKDTVIKMTNTLFYRGPDDAGFFVDKNNGVALGHTRLSILNLSPKGYQLMESPSGGYVVVYNGEIYNYRDLRYNVSVH